MQLNSSAHLISDVDAVAVETAAQDLTTSGVQVVLTLSASEITELVREIQLTANKAKISQSVDWIDTSHYPLKMGQPALVALYAALGGSDAWTLNGEGVVV